MDRTFEFSRVVELFQPESKNSVSIPSQGATQPPSAFLGLAMRANSQLESNDVLVNKMSALADRKEFSNDPSSAMAEITEVFNKKAHAIQHDLSIMKKKINDISEFRGSGVMQQQHCKFIMEALNKRQAAHVTSFQASAKRHASNVEQRNKRVGKYGHASALNVPSTDNKADAKRAGGGSVREDDSYAMFSAKGPSLLPPGQTRQLNNSVGMAAARQGGSLGTSKAALPTPPPQSLAPAIRGAPALTGAAEAQPLAAPAAPLYADPPSGPAAPPPSLHHSGAEAEGGENRTTPGAWNPNSAYTQNPIPPAVSMPISPDAFHRPANTYTSRRRPVKGTGQGRDGQGQGGFHDQYYSGYGDGSKYSNGGSCDDGYQNPKMAQQKRDRSRLKGAEQVEAAIAQMGSLFSQVATMVMEQGEVMSRIEDDVENGLEEVKAGHEQMERFYELSKQGRGTILILTGVAAVFIFFFLYVR